ncbi:MAG: hypothetical protein QXL94_01560 [Candidatus Parvarchaeum sp.]
MIVEMVQPQMFKMKFTEIEKREIYSILEKHFSSVRTGKDNDSFKTFNSWEIDYEDIQYEKDISFLGKSGSRFAYRVLSNKHMYYDELSTTSIVGRKWDGVHIYKYFLNVRPLLYLGTRAVKILSDSYLKKVIEGYVEFLALLKKNDANAYYEYKERPFYDKYTFELLEKKVKMGQLFGRDNNAEFSLTATVEEVLHNSPPLSSYENDDGYYNSDDDDEYHDEDERDDIDE